MPPPAAPARARAGEKAVARPPHSTPGLAAAASRSGAGKRGTAPPQWRGAGQGDTPPNRPPPPAPPLPSAAAPPAPGPGVGETFPAPAAPLPRARRTSTRDRSLVERHASFLTVFVRVLLREGTGSNSGRETIPTAETTKQLLSSGQKPNRAAAGVSSSQQPCGCRAATGRARRGEGVWWSAGLEPARLRLPAGQKGEKNPKDTKMVPFFFHHSEQHRME